MLRALALGARAPPPRAWSSPTIARRRRRLRPRLPGHRLLWRGDFQNARQMLIALASRADRRPGKPKPPAATATPPAPAAAFNRHRQAQSQRARTLGMLLLQLDGHYGIALRRAPDVRQACEEAYGPGEGTLVVSLRELLGLIGAHSGAARASRSRRSAAASIRTTECSRRSRRIRRPGGQGTLAGRDAVVRHGIRRRHGDGCARGRTRAARHQACGRHRPGSPCARLRARQSRAPRLGGTSGSRAGGSLPEGRAALVVCNPPWVPARPSSPIERGIDDPESRMLRAFLAGLAAHWNPAAKAG